MTWGKPSNYFCSLEKCNDINKTKQCVEIEDGNICTEQNNIIEKAIKFYENLYKNRKI